MTEQTQEASCRPCDLGFYQDEPGKDHCKACPQGKYQDTKGQKTCKPCWPGTYNGFTGQTNVSDCKPRDKGTYQPLESQSMCDDCDAGTYQNKTGSTECIKCLASHLAISAIYLMVSKLYVCHFMCLNIDQITVYQSLFINKANAYRGSRNGMTCSNYFDSPSSVIIINAII